MSDTVARFNPHFVPSGWVTDQTSTAKLDQLVEQLCEAQRINSE